MTVSVCDRGWGAVSACSGHIPHIPVWIGREPNSIPTPPHWEIEEEEEGERERDEERKRNQERGDEGKRSGVEQPAYRDRI